MLVTRLAAVGAGAVTVAAAALSSPAAAPASASANTRPAVPAAGLRPGSVTIINTRTDKVSATVRVGLVPTQVVVTPDGKTGYVLNDFSATVTQIKIGRSVTTRRVRGSSAALGLALTPDGRTLYLSRHSNTGPGSVLPVNARTGVPGRPVNLPPSGGNSFGTITVVPNGRQVLTAEFLVGNQASEGLLPIRTATSRPGRLISFGRAFYQPLMMTVTPDSRTAFVLGADGNGNHGDLLTPIHVGSGKAAKSLMLPAPQVAMTMTPNGRFIYLADYFDGTVTVVRTATDTVIKRIPVSGAFSVATSPDGKTVYAGGADPSTGVPEVVPIATASNSASAPIRIGQDGGGTITAIAVTPDGRTAYFAILSTSNFVVPMDTAARTLGPPIGVGPRPMAIVIARRAPIMYVVNSNNQF